MDSLYTTLLQSGDVMRTRIVLMDRIATSILDVEKALKGMKLPTFKASVSIEFKLDDVASKAMQGGVLAELTGFPLELGAALGAVLGIVKFQATSIPTPLAVRNGPFAYLYNVRKELR
jgi:hypothetical protein